VLECLPSTPLRDNVEVVGSKILWSSAGTGGFSIFVIQARVSRESLLAFLPPRLGCLYGDLSVQLLGHDLEPAFTTDVTASAADEAHLAREIGKRNCFKMCRLFTLCMQQVSLPRSLICGPLGNLVSITRSCRRSFGSRSVPVALFEGSQRVGDCLARST